MTEDNTYNGYTNYSTWNANLWLNNDIEIYKALQYEAEQSQSPLVFAGLLKDFVSDNELKFDTKCDFNEVNWQEIAEKWQDWNEQ